MILNQSIESEKWSQLADCLGVREARHLTIHPIDQFFGYWVAEPEFVKRLPTDSTMLFHFSFSPQTPATPSKFPDNNYKMASL